MWANTWHQHLTQLAEQAGNSLAVAVLELHKPDECGDCRGCDAEGYEWEPPEWGCSTVQLIAETFGLALQGRCPSCGSERRTLVSGGPVGHHVREGDMWVSCPGSTEKLEEFPHRSEAEVMAELTERMVSSTAAVIQRSEAALGLPSPVPAAVQLHAVRKWGQQIEFMDRFGR